MIDETVEEIRQMQTHSSSVVAVKAVRALSELGDREFATVGEYVRSLERNGNALRRANPSHASLQNAVRDVVRAVEDANPEDVETARSVTQEAVEAVVDRVQEGKRRAAKNAVDLFEDGTTVLTHDYSSTVLEAVELATGDGAHLDTYVTEARPRYLGRKTARRLAEMGRVDAHLIIDSAAGHFLPECDRVVIGMDCIVGDTLYNRIGTFPIVATAAEVGVPVTVVGSGTKVIEEGFVFENEIRGPSEVMREPAEGFAVENPAYDATPTELLSAVITDEGRREF
jgi:translation initiation factor eIF-2B subunit delta